jgi:hypothetical protein
MPRKSTKVVDHVAPISTLQVDPAPAPSPCLKSDTKKRAPVKRTNQKKDALPPPPPTIPLVNETTPPPPPQPQPIQVTDNVNTFNIHINHVSEDGNSIENTFSTSYSHTNANSKSSSSGNNTDTDTDSDSDEDSDYDTKFKNSSSSLSLPASISAAINSLLASTASMVSEDENPLYTIQQINYDILIPFVLINMHASSRENIMALLHTTLISCIEGRCITEGFIKPRSTRIIDFKCGKIIAKNVQFNIVIECLVCNPRAQSVISCVAKNITQAGIRALSDDEYSPIVVYITRDFGVDSDKTYYNSIKEGDKINIKVIGKRFEMNDKHIQIIGFLVHPKKERISVATAIPSLSKKSFVAVNASPSPTTMTEAKEEPVAKTSAAKRAPRKTKNALSITNDTDNNVITITYDADIDLPKAPKAPKAPKKSKKESVGAGVGDAVAVTNE